MKPTRPALRYHGGKFRLATWILSHFPPHRVYVEPYAGAASCLLLKPPAYAEIINDLDGEVVNVFRVLRDPGQAQELARLLTLTPFAREEFVAAYEPSDDPVEQARRTIIKTFMGMGSNSIHSNVGMRTMIHTRNPKTGFRAVRLAGSSPASDFVTYPEQIERFCARLRGVVIENRDALSVIRQHDRQDTLFFVDPPYVHSTRYDPRHGYRHEMTDAQHRDLAAVLHQVQGLVVLAGYPGELYDRELYPRWQKVLKTSLKDRAKRAIECLWFNPAAAEHLNPRLELD